MAPLRHQNQVVQYGEVVMVAGKARPSVLNRTCKVNSVFGSDG
jgi:hypothetical protein